ncbi:MBL fold metallo-hydrolase [Pseudoroseicyclus sp. CXY001]|uniref:MBL fold metallo-hydrolase n=1 Tax=Pseudoroseicyclus sp. CXY001 TaxID=3242492 RepID=UPI00358DD400
MSGVPEVRRLVAPNPSPMTERGTNTWLIGREVLAVIDPGPADEAHLAALTAAIGGRPVAAILVTHPHLDHSALAPALAEATGAPVMAHGGAAEGRSPVMARLAAEGLTGGGEGADAAFCPDRRLADGEVISGPGWALEALWTPGHMGAHLSFRLGDDIFTGDLAMGWASSLISPPDGDVAQFRASCRRLLALGPGRLLPGHGDVVEAGAARLSWLLDHRAAREAEIRAALAATPASPQELAARLYAGLPPAMLPAAARNVLAHLIDLTERNLARPEGPLTPDARFHRL